MIANCSGNTSSCAARSVVLTAHLELSQMLTERVDDRAVHLFVCRLPHDLCFEAGDLATQLIGRDRERRRAP
jgi:hypothetical protein